MRIASYAARTSLKSASVFFATELDADRGVIAYIDMHGAKFWVEPICRVLQFAPRTYWATKAGVSARQAHDEVLKPEFVRVHAESFGVYGADKVWVQLNREGHRVARCTIERSMRDLGLQAAVRGKKHRTTITDDLATRPRDQVDRNFTAVAPNRLWVGPHLRQNVVGVRVRRVRHRRVLVDDCRLAGITIAAH